MLHPGSMEILMKGLAMFVISDILCRVCCAVTVRNKNLSIIKGLWLKKLMALDIKLDLWSSLIHIRTVSKLSKVIKGLAKIKDLSKLIKNLTELLCVIF